jgi:hypothetical protein
LTKAELDAARKLIQPNPCSPIIRKDRERKPVLDAFVKILETNENLPGEKLETGVESVRV